MGFKQKYLRHYWLKARTRRRAPGPFMEPAILTLQGVEVAGATDGSHVSLSVAAWLRLGGQVALAAPAPPPGPRQPPRRRLHPLPVAPLPPPAPALGGVALPPRGRPPVLASARAGRPLPRALLRPLRPRLRRSSRRSRWSPSLLFLHRRTARRRALRRVAPHPRLAFPKHPAVGPRAVATVPGAPSAPARAFLLAGPPAHPSLPSRHPGPSQSPPTLLPGRGLPRSADPVGSACALRFSRQQAPHATPRRPALRHPPPPPSPPPPLLRAILSRQRGNSQAL